MFGVLGVLGGWALVGSAGCSRDRAHAGAVATELCKWGQLDDLSPDVLPPEVDLVALVREADRRYAVDQHTLTPSSENPFLALAQTAGMKVEEPAAAMSQALANKSVCSVEVEVEGDVAKAHVERSVGIPVAAGDDVFLLLNALNQLGSREERVALIEGRIDAATDKRTSSHDLVVERVGDRWIANLGLPEAAIARAETELAGLKETIAFGETSRSELGKLEVLATHYLAHSSKRSSIPRVDITVRNGTAERLTRVDFHGVLTSEARDTPWVDAELSHQVRGKLEPGATEEFTIVSRLPVKWRTRAPDGANLQVTPIRAAGADGKVLWDVVGLDDAKAAAAVLEERVSSLKGTYLSG